MLPAILLILTMCKKDEWFTFTITDSTTFDITPITPIALPYELPLPDITTNSEQEFKNNNTSVGLVKEIKLSTLDLFIQNPADKTFSFLKAISIYIRTNDDDEILLATKTDIDSDAKMISLNTTEAILDKYVKADSYKLRTEVTLRETLTQAVTIEAKMKYNVKADPL